MLKLRQIRKAKQMTVPALAKEAGISRRTIEDAEARGDCRMSTAYKLATALDVSLDDLWEPDEAGE
ncbi:MAG: helix-turn-helix transcriptional regulator [Anaerovoracaceae bacterium]